MNEEEVRFRREIEEYYLPRDLVSAILRAGAIPRGSVEALIGIGFADIADYTWLSKFLSPSENQAILNGIFTAFSLVLRKRGAYLNKIQGDSIMFHFGGPIDPQVEGLTPHEQNGVIAKNLFYTCVELQRVCLLFNEANESFLKVARDEESVEAMRRAFEIIRALRTNVFIGQSINALYQIRIRIGASLGEVTIGNFGPRDARHWDVIGVPVIQAKRMESSAPVGGLRITQELYEILKEHGIVETYHGMFRKEALTGRGRYGAIGIDELFKPTVVRLKEKSNAEFDSYSVQVDPLLPERIARQARLLLGKGTDGIERIVGFFQYYRGNGYALDALERLFILKNIRVDRAAILRLVDLKRYKLIYAEEGGNVDRVSARIEAEYSFEALFHRLGEIQDAIKDDPHIVSKTLPFETQKAYSATVLAKARKTFSFKSGYIKRRAWFHTFLYPMIFTYFRAAMLEYQGRISDVDAQ
jgi:adenylate cyclase